MFQKASSIIQEIAAKRTEGLKQYVGNIKDNKTLETRPLEEIVGSDSSQANNKHYLIPDRF